MQELARANRPSERPDPVVRDNGKRSLGMITSPRTRIAVILPRGEAIRNFVYTDALGDMGPQCEVLLLSVIPSAEIQQLLEERFERVFELEHTKENWAVSTIRELLNIAHDQWLCSEASRDRRNRQKHAA